MENLIREKTSLTPQIQLLTNGAFLLKGISTPENVQSFFQPIIDWLEEYKKTNPPSINFIMEMDYLNSSSSKVLIRMLSILNTFKSSGTQLILTWRYDEGDEDMLEVGKDLQHGSKSEMVFVSINKN